MVMTSAIIRLPGGRYFFVAESRGYRDDNQRHYQQRESRRSTKSIGDRVDKGWVRADAWINSCLLTAPQRKLCL